MIRSIQAFAFAVILFGLTTTRAQANLVITLSDVTLGPGGIGTMDISATSNNIVSGDTLSSFGLELVITPVGTPSSTPSFLSGADQPIAFYDDTNYVFYQQSFNANPAYGGPYPFWSDPYASPPPDSYPAGEITGGDSADPAGPGYVSISSSDTYLLAQVQFSVPRGAMVGDTFQISLVSDPNFTFFYDQTGNNLVSYQSSGGLVTVATAVPEPSSLTMMAISGLSGLLAYRRRRTRGQRARSSAVVWIRSTFSEPADVKSLD